MKILFRSAQTSTLSYDSLFEDKKTYSLLLKFPSFAEMQIGKIMVRGCELVIVSMTDKVENHALSGSTQKHAQNLEAMVNQYAEDYVRAHFLSKPSHLEIRPL